MFHKSALGIQRGSDDVLTVRIDGSRTELLVLLSTLNAKVLSELVDNPEDFSQLNTALQENTLKAFMGMLVERTDGIED